MSQSDLYSDLMRKLMTDPAFRSEFKGNPRNALARMGINIPADINFHVHEMDDKNVHFVMPRPIGDDTKLSEDELEKVAGGGTTSLICPTTPIEGCPPK